MWNEVSTSSKNPGQIFKQITQKLDIEDQLVENKRDFNSRLNHSNTSTRFSILKYAAIFILAFGTGLLISRYQVSSEVNSEGKNEISVAYGSKSQVKLSDGSVVWLNAGSKLEYPDKFLSEYREVKLTGEAYFEVTGNKKRPFIVKAGDIDINVLGTKFNVQCYSDDNKIITTLVEGEITIQKKDDKSGEQIYLLPNQKAVYYKSVNRLAVVDPESKPIHTTTAKPTNIPKLQVNKIESTELYTGWTNNKLIFSKEVFPDLIIKLERWYDVEIELNNRDLMRTTYTGTFTNETIEQAMEALSIAADFEYSIQKNKITIN